ncbi:MAG: phosphatidylglycerophosphatase A [Acidobacteria bacterium]|nr:phosphatidylglycerophosphatase A [Acidobacteriota bacterium]
MKNSAAALIATVFGCGRVPRAPGTAGSVAAVAAAWLLSARAGWAPYHFALASAALLPLAVWSAGVVGRAGKVADPPKVVIDELLGQWLTIAGASRLSWKSMLAAFILFRAFDVWKPFPVRSLESLPGGFGVVADDMMAGIYGAVVLFLAGCFNFY